MMVNLFGSLFDKVLSIVKDWEPRKQYNREEGYRDDLIGFLRKELNKPVIFGGTVNHLVQKESGRHLADIGVDGKVGIELKLNLLRKAQVDRLIGQVKGFLRDYEGVIIVLCGKVSEERVDYLKTLLQEYTQPTIFEPEKKVEIVIKTFKQTTKKQSTGLFGLGFPEFKFLY